MSSLSGSVAPSGSGLAVSSTPRGRGKKAAAATRSAVDVLADAATTTPKSVRKGRETQSQALHGLIPPEEESRPLASAAAAAMGRHESSLVAERRSLSALFATPSAAAVPSRPEAAPAASPSSRRLLQLLKHPLMPAAASMLLAVLIAAYMLHFSHSSSSSSRREGWLGGGREGGIGSLQVVEELRKEVAEQMKRVKEEVAKAAKAVQVQVASVDSELLDLRKQHETFKQLVAEQQKETERKLRGMNEMLGRVEEPVRVLFERGSPMVQQEVRELVNEVLRSKAASDEKPVSLEEVQQEARRIVELHVAQYDADKVARADFALAAAGGLVIAHSAAVQVRGMGSMGQRLKLLLHSTMAGMMAGSSKDNKDEQQLLHFNAQKVLDGSAKMVPGNCLPLKGQEGMIDVRLRTRVAPDAISLEHIPKSIAFSINSAPREFDFLGLVEGSQNQWQPLGSFEYNLTDKAVQTFELRRESNWSGQIVRLQIKSNHGHPNFTCIYRLRVHGTPASTLEG